MTTESSGLFDCCVSVIIPVYNREELLPEAIESVYRQCYRPIELIIVDDGSRDQSLSVAHAAKSRLNSEEFSVKVVSQPNGGVSTARNHGLRVCSGKYVQFLDSDDLYHPEKTSLCVAAAIRDSAELVVPLCCSFTSSEHGVQLLSETPCEMNIDYSEYDTLYSRFLWSTNGPLIARSLIERVGGFREDLPYAEDREFFIRLRASANRIARISKRLSFFRKGAYDRLTAAAPESPVKLSSELQQCYLSMRELVKAQKYTRNEAAYLIKRSLKCSQRLVRRGELSWALKGSFIAGCCALNGVWSLGFSSNGNGPEQV